MAIIRSIRRFFDAQGFDEVETPILQICPTMDCHIHGFKTQLKDIDLKHKKDFYLHTSPEFAMKKLLVAGVEKLYQICPVFRNAEGSKIHRPEFTMIEWYRAQADYTDIMKDCEDLLKSCTDALGFDVFCYKDLRCDPHQPWQYLSVSDAFQSYAEINLVDFLEDLDGFKQVTAALGIRVAEDDLWDDVFFRIMDDRIEPFLGVNQPTILYDYPLCMASLARRKPEDPRFAERFELYICGVELANAFSELTDVDEQKRRFLAEMSTKQDLYGESYPVDEDFIAAIGHGMPESGGIALGIDRLVMLATGAQDIRQVAWCDI